MSAIKAGDLVMVVRPGDCPCRSSSRLVGGIGEVSEVRRSWTGAVTCRDCGTSYETQDLLARIPDLADNPDEYRSGWFAVWRLIKIDPPAQPESVEHDEWVSV